jgi:Putative Ig domain
VPTNSVVPTMVVNGGAPAYTDCNGQSVSLVGQSSVIEQLQVTFNEPVTLDANAFTITNIAEAITVLSGPNPSTYPVTAIQTPLAGSGNTQWIVSFSGYGTNAISGGTGTVIKDGLYLLTTIGSKVHADGDTAADNNVVFWALNGSTVAGDLMTDGYNWEVSVGASDYAHFVSTYGSESNTGTIPYNPAFDFNLDGAVDATDYGIFTSAYNAEWTMQTDVVLPSPGDQTNSDGDAVSVSAAAIDVAGNAVTYAADNLPIGLSINSSTGTISGTIDSSADIAGPYSVTVTATDSTADVSVSQTFNWTVNFQPVAYFASTQFGGSVGTSATIEVDLDAASASDVTVDYATSNGTATAGTDYTGASGTLTIPAGDTSGTFSVALTAKATPQSAKTLTVTLSDGSGAALGNVSIATVTIFESVTNGDDLLTDLNTDYGLIDAALEGGIGVYGANDGTDMANLANAVAELETIRVGIAATPPTNTIANYESALRDTPAGLPACVQTLITHADILIETAEGDAADSQGENFRIEGIGADMDRLYDQLELARTNIDAQKTALSSIRSNLSATDQTRLDAAVENLTTAIGSIDQREDRAEAVYTENIDASVTGGDGVVALNTQWTAMQVKLGDVKTDSASVVSLESRITLDLNLIANDLDTTETDLDYSGALLSMDSSAEGMHTATGVTVTDGGGDAVSIASAAATASTYTVEGASAKDEFAHKGIKSILNQINAELQYVYDLTEAQYEFVDQLPQDMNTEAWLTSLYNIAALISPCQAEIATVSGTL